MRADTADRLERAREVDEFVLAELAKGPSTADGLYRAGWSCKQRILAFDVSAALKRLRVRGRVEYAGKKWRIKP